MALAGTKQACFMACVDSQEGRWCPCQSATPYALRCFKCEGADYPGLEHNDRAPYCIEHTPSADDPMQVWIS